MAMPVMVPQYTVDDLDGFPDDGNRYELLDGMLLVTPAPGGRHQIIAARLIYYLSEPLVPGNLGKVTGPGVIILRPRTQLEPDVLVFPGHISARTEWVDVSEHWLAVEVISRSSRMYDREFKRDAYLALGVKEVWLVDPRNETVEVTRKKGAFETFTDVVRWRVPTLDIIVTVDLKLLFAD